jgi:hypothetical protein
MHEQTFEALADAVGRFDEASYDPATIRAHAEQFDTGVFRRDIQALIEKQVGG